MEPISIFLSFCLFSKGKSTCHPLQEMPGGWRSLRLIIMTTLIKLHHHQIRNTCTAAFWMGDQRLVIGKVVRMHCSPTTKSAYPILQWKKDDPRSNVVTCCVNVAPIDVKSDTWSLQLKDCFMFCPMKALLIQLRVIDRQQGLKVNTNNMAKIRSMLPQLH